MHNDIESQQAVTRTHIRSFREHFELQWGWRLYYINFQGIKENSHLLDVKGVSKDSSKNSAYQHYGQLETIA